MISNIDQITTNIIVNEFFNKDAAVHGQVEEEK